MIYYNHYQWASILGKVNITINNIDYVLIIGTLSSMDKKEDLYYRLFKNDCLVFGRWLHPYHFNSFRGQPDDPDLMPLCEKYVLKFKKLQTFT
jgi:hypothetical protein